jgi:hypothetical protein
VARGPPPRGRFAELAAMIVRRVHHRPHTAADAPRRRSRWAWHPGWPAAQA